MSASITERLRSDTHHRIDSEEQLRDHYGDTHERAARKSLPALDTYCRRFIGLSPFLCLATQHANGTADVSPRGDPAGFVRVLDDHTLAIPDRPGNNRLDSLSNILSNPSVGLLFLVPGFDDTLRVNGSAFLSRDPALLASMAVRQREPSLAIIVEVHEAFLHCAKAFRRSRLWQADSHQDRSLLPSLAVMINEQITGTATDEGEARELEQELENAYRQSMY